jgi:hypothetical protein
MDNTKISFDNLPKMQLIQCCGNRGIYETKVCYIYNGEGIVKKIGVRCPKCFAFIEYTE